MTFLRLRYCHSLGLVLLAASALLGCGGAADGPERYPISGEITYDGKPLPAGEVFFTPDTSKGNSGPQSVATIEDGHYETAPGKGHVGGPHIVKVAGYDGVPNDMSPRGMSLFTPYETEADLPQKEKTQDFEVPSQPVSKGMKSDAP